MTTTTKQQPKTSTAKTIKPPTKTKTKLRKHPQAPKLPRSSYTYFSSDRLKVLRRKVEAEAAPEGLQDGKKSKKEIVAAARKLLSEEWKNLTPKERATYDGQAYLDKIRFATEKAMYGDGLWQIELDSIEPMTVEMKKQCEKREKRAMVMAAAAFTTYHCKPSLFPSNNNVPTPQYSAPTPSNLNNSPPTEASGGSEVPSQTKEINPLPSQHMVTSQRSQGAASSNAADTAVASINMPAPPNDFYYDAFFRHAVSYGEHAAREFYGVWAPPVGVLNPYNQSVGLPSATASAAAEVAAALLGLDPTHKGAEF